MLTVSNVTKRYGKAAALDGVSFALEPGRVLAVIGANGAGKTTLIKCIVGLVRYSGEVRVGNIDVSRDGKAARRLIGYLPQTSSLPPDLTVQEAAVFYAQLKGVDETRAREAVESAGLEAHATKQVSELSGGMTQRLGLALALLADPPLVILDEPAAGLDISARLDLRKLIEDQRRAGKSVLLSTHWIEDVPYVADQALLLDSGKTVYFGPADRLATNQAAASRLYLRLNGSTPDAVPVVRATASAQSVDQSGDWLVVTCPADDKARVVEALVAAGIGILDFRVEEAPVSEAVLRMKDAQEASK
ncbi:MAG: ABC transporter ATP-binding protein [Dehalococcoidia bacterium]